MVTRLCVRARSIVSCFTIQKTPFLLGDPSEPVVVTD